MDAPQVEKFDDLRNIWQDTLNRIIDRTTLPLYVNYQTLQVSIGTTEPKTYAASADSVLVVSGGVYVTGTVSASSGVFDDFEVINEITAASIDVAGGLTASAALFDNLSVTNNITASSGSYTGNVTASAFAGDGTQLVLPNSVTSSSFGNLTASNLTASAFTFTSAIGSGSVTASAFHGDGTSLELPDNVTASSYVNLSADNIVASSIELQAAGTSVPNANTLYKDNVCKVWIRYNGSTATTASDLTGVIDHFNVAALVDTGTGQQRVEFDRDFANSSFVCVSMHTNDTEGNATNGDHAVGSVTISTWNGSVGLIDAVNVNAIMFGDQ